jgi:arylsulfatase A-like enzyme
MDQKENREFQRDEVIEKVVPVYMGLVKQIDDNIGRLMSFMEEQGRLDDTMIVFTSDHGDFLGDHWLGEKQLFHDPSARIPVVIVDPDPAADATRGTVDDRLVEAIDLIPTFVDVCGGAPYPHRLEGRSLMPLLRGGEAGSWRDMAFSEADYSFLEAGTILNVGATGGRAFMALGERWKYIHYENFRPQLFDMDNDADELHDLGESAEHADVRADMHERLFQWLRNRRTRTSMDDESVVKRAGKKPKGLKIGEW